MTLYESIDEIERDGDRATTLTIGTFDGMHRGHRAVVDRCVSAARADGRRAMVVTFADHPLSLLAPPHAPALLTTRRRKVDLLEAAGVEVVACLPFDETLAEMEAAAFTRNVLFDRCGATAVYCGYDFNFGRGGEGGPQTIARLGEERGIVVETSPPVIDDDLPISSTRIREDLQEGRVAAANRLLGRAYELEGSVIAGFQRGRKMEFPTANLSVSPRACVPLTGVYAVRAFTTDGCEWGGMVNIGRAPTFGVNESRVEVNLFEFEGDLYGSQLRVAFIERLREERRFDSPEALMEQLRLDRENAYAALTAN